MKNWGADYESLRRLRPDIITIGMPGFGATGPYGNFVSYGEPLEGAIGLLRLGGYDEGHPERAGVAYLDPTGGVSAALAVLGALRHRQVTGEGQDIDFSQRDAGTRLIGEAWLAYQLTGETPQMFGSRHPEWSPHGIYPCAGDDRWVAIAVRSDAEWAAFCRAAAVDPPPDLAGAEARLAERKAMDAIVSGWTRGRSDSEAAGAFLAAGLPAAAVTFEAELFEHPQHLAREFFPEIEHPVTGRRRLALTPLRFLWGPAGTLRRAPLFGEHNRQVLVEVLGLSPQEVERLEAEGIVGGRPEMGDIMHV
jgi:crotonobetainyl-CoA:carnitine CoA-transferase CaiB-like acyl-CoA transferase